MFGMSEKEFWEDDPQLYWAYQTFYLKKKELDLDEMNYNAWLKGIYVLSALNQSLSNAFGKKSQQKDIYPKEPINVNKTEKTKKVYTKEEKEEQYVQEFNSWARINNRK